MTTAAVYRAEQFVRRQLEFAREGGREIEFFGSTIVIPDEIWFGSLSAVQNYCDQMMNTSWWKENFTLRAKVKVRQRKGNDKAHYEPWTHTIAVHANDTKETWGMRELVICHEMAHHASINDPNPHGDEFVKSFLTIVNNAMGPEIALLLRAAFYENGVKV